jgi:DNA gyrase subunit A
VIAKVVINNLYKHTALESSFGVIMLALDGRRPKLMPMRDMLFCYLEHRREVVIRRTKFDLNVATAQPAYTVSAQKRKHRC